MVSKMFLDCHNKLKDMKSELLAETEAVDKKFVYLEIMTFHIILNLVLVKQLNSYHPMMSHSLCTL